MNSKQNNTRFYIMAVSLAILAALSGALFWKMLELRSKPSFESLIVLPQAKAVADFALYDEMNNSFSLADFRGRWSVLFFGFTSCPDICPNTLYQLQQVRAELASEVTEEELPVIYLVSVDPDRDSPEKLAGYLSFFNPAFKGITGPDEQLRPLTMQLGIAYHVEEHETGASEYDVDHSASLLLLNPQGELYGVFPAPQETGKLSRDLLQIIN